MAVSNPLVGQRKLNSVGKPLPGYAVRLAAEDGTESKETPPEGFLSAGEIQVAGDGVFREYWGKPEATSETFTPDGTWFKTGDLGALDEEGYLYILGRLSADIIKSGGFKISALDIERELLTMPRVGECAVVGLPDDTWGEKVVAVLTLKGASESESAALAGAVNADPSALAALHGEIKEFLRDKLPPYKVPSLIRVLPAIPRNAMGKVGKKALKVELWPEIMAAASAAKSPGASPLGSGLAGSPKGAFPS